MRTRSMNISQIMSDYFRMYGEGEKMRLEDLFVDVEECSLFVAGIVQWLEGWANQSHLPPLSVFTAVIGRGIYRLWDLEGAQETEAFELRSLPEPVDALRNMRFQGLDSTDGKTLSVRFPIDDVWSRNCQILAECVGIEDPWTIPLMALITGLVDCDEISEPDKVEIRNIIQRFLSWIGLRLVELNKIYQVSDSGELYKKVERANHRQAFSVSGY